MRITSTCSRMFGRSSTRASLPKCDKAAESAAGPSKGDQAAENAKQGEAAMEALGDLFED